MPILGKNPLTMVGTLDRCWLFTYQTPLDEARPLVPPALELVTREGCAFWNVVVCHLRAMRPKGFPAFLGASYWHVAYRLYVSLHPAEGRPIEGLYFARSDADSRLMVLAGNLLTDFRFHPAAVRITEDPAPRPLDINRSAAPAVCQTSLLRIAIDSPDAPAQMTLDRIQSPELPPHSAFSSLEEAAAFLKYKPFGISLTRRGQANVVAIRRDEAAWRSRLVQVVSADWRFFEGNTVRPEICYEVAPIDYQWNRGRQYVLQASV